MQRSDRVPVETAEQHADRSSAWLCQLAQRQYARPSCAAECMTALLVPDPATESHYFDN